MRLYDAELGRFTSVDPLWEEQLPYQPYHYARNAPLVYKDPTGESPFLVGFLIGAGIEMGSQMIFENRSLSEVDYGRVGVAGFAGLLTGGLSAFSSTTRIAGAALISVAEGAAKRAVSGEKTTVGDVATDAALGGFAGKGAETLAKSAFGSAEGKMLKDQLRRAENAVADGRPRPAQANRVVAAREALNNVGRGPKEDLMVGVGKEGADKIFKIVFAPPKQDNTDVSTPLLIKR